MKQRQCHTTHDQTLVSKEQEHHLASCVSKLQTGTADCVWDGDHVWGASVVTLHEVRQKHCTIAAKHYMHTYLKQIA